MLTPLATMLVATAMGGDPPVQVIVDMNAAMPGIQSTVHVTTCTTVVEDVAVWVIDPLGRRQMYSIGYLGGIDRGIAFGHMPDRENHGTIVAVEGCAVLPVNPANTAYTVPPEWTDPAFAGPEVQYVEWGAEAPAVIPAAPAGPIFVVDIHIEDALPGDRFSFWLVDFTSIWGGPGQAGAFSTQGPAITLDTGGDAVPDGTVTIHGVDPDLPVAVPPAAFLVDYVDNVPGNESAFIQIHPEPEDTDGSGEVDIDDLIWVLVHWDMAASLPDPTQDGVVDVEDLIAVILAWGGC